MKSMIGNIHLKMFDLRQLKLESGCVVLGQSSTHSPSR